MDTTSPTSVAVTPSTSQDSVAVTPSTSTNTVATLPPSTFKIGGISYTGPVTCYEIISDQIERSFVRISEERNRAASSASHQEPPTGPSADHSGLVPGQEPRPPRSQCMEVLESIVDMLCEYPGISCDKYHRKIALVLASNEGNTLEEFVKIHDEIQTTVNQLMCEANIASQTDELFLSLRSRFTSILDTFTLITGKLGPDSFLTQQLIKTHQRQLEVSKKTLVSQLGVIAMAIKEFALSQFLFSSLCKEDQKILLRNNIPLYLQYVLARYFSSDTGLSQLNWITEGQITTEPLKRMGKIFRISLNEYNSVTGLFSDMESYRLYLRFAENIGMFYPLPHHCNALIANMILFYIDDSISGNLKEEQKVAFFFRESKDLVTYQLESLHRTSTCHNNSCVGPLIQTLVKMKTVFAESVVFLDNGSSRLGVPHQIAVNYSHGEEFWIQTKLNLFKQEYISVTPPEPYMSELFALLLHGQRVSEGFIETWMKMENERIRRVLKIHSEFRNLSDHDQDFILRSNQAAAIALTVVRVEIQKTGKDQFKQIVGVIGNRDSSWEDLYEVDLNTMKSFYLHNKELSLGKLDARNMRCYFDTLREISQLVANPQIYQLFFLLTLLDLEGLPESKSFSDILQLRQDYLRVFQRKLASVGCSLIDYVHFRATLKKVRTFARLMENFLQ